MKTLRNQYKVLDMNKLVEINGGYSGSSGGSCYSSATNPCGSSVTSSGYSSGSTSYSSGSTINLSRNQILFALWASAMGYQF